MSGFSLFKLVSPILILFFYFYYKIYNKKFTVVIRTKPYFSPFSIPSSCLKPLLHIKTVIVVTLQF